MLRAYLDFLKFGCCRVGIDGGCGLAQVIGLRVRTLGGSPLATFFKKLLSEFAALLVVPQIQSHIFLDFVGRFDVSQEANERRNYVRLEEHVFSLMHLCYR